MATQTKSDRSTAAKKAAATRQRNQQRATNKIGGRKAAATRQTHDAEQAADQAVRQVKRAARGVVSGATSAVRFSGVAATEATKAVATRVGLYQEARERTNGASTPTRTRAGSTRSGSARPSRPRSGSTRSAS
jgi:hypothetical protein